MRLFLILFAGLFLTLQSAAAQEFNVTLDNELFTKQSVMHLPSGDIRIEFVRRNENFNDWSKRVSLRQQQLDGIENDPRQAAAAMEQLVKSYNDRSQSRIIVNNQTSEALIDFLTWPPDAQHLEFNVFRFAKTTDGNAVVSVQLTYRLVGQSALDIEQFRKIRASWVNQAVAFDMSAVQTELAAQ